MKYLILFSSVLLLLSCDCGKNKESKDYDVIETPTVVGKTKSQPKSYKKKEIVVDHVVPPTEAERLCIVGKSYVMCSDPNSNDPFKKGNRYTVVILAKKQGWVKYCHDEDVDNPERETFTDPCDNFITLIQACN